MLLATAKRIVSFAAAVAAVLAIAALSCLPENACAKTVYIGIAGPGMGPGVMGHSFLVIAEQPGRFLDARYYQYAFKLAESVSKHFSLDPRRLSRLRSIPFRLETGSAWNFIQSYNTDERVVRLFEIQLRPEQIDQMIEKAEAERKLRRAVMQFDYSLFSNNCETKILDLLNSVLPDYDKFDYIPFQQQGFLSLAAKDPGRVAMTIPIGVAPVLESHPLVGEKFTFRPKATVALAAAVKGFEELDPLFEACKVSQDLRGVLADLYGNPVIRHSQKYLKALSRVFSRCADEKGLVEVYNGHLDFLRFDTDDEGFLKMSETYYLVPAPEHGPAPALAPSP